MVQRCEAQAVGDVDGFGIDINKVGDDVKRDLETIHSSILYQNGFEKPPNICKKKGRAQIGILRTYLFQRACKAQRSHSRVIFLTEIQILGIS